MSTLMRININEQRAQVGVNNVRSNLGLTKPRQAIRVNNQPTQLHIDSPPPTFTNDQTAVRRDMNIISSLEFARNFADEGRRTAFRGIGRRASDGDVMARLQVQGRDPIPVLARNASMARLGPLDFNIGLMPRSMPNMTWHVNRININFTRHNLTVDANHENTVQVSQHPRFYHERISTYLQVRDRIEITAVPLDIRV